MYPRSWVFWEPLCGRGMCNNRLKEMYFDNCNLDEYNTVCLLADGVLRCNGLETLGFEGCTFWRNIYDCGICFIAEAVVGSGLKELFLVDMDFNVNELTHLVNMLGKERCGLERLTICFKQKEYRDAIISTSLLEDMFAINRLTYIWLTFGYFSKVQCQAVAEGLLLNRTLVECVLLQSDNVVSPAWVFGDVMCRHGMLEKIDLRWNESIDEDLERMERWSEFNRKAKMKVADLVSGKERLMIGLWPLVLSKFGYKPAHLYKLIRNFFDEFYDDDEIMHV